MSLRHATSILFFLTALLALPLAYAQSSAPRGRALSEQEIREVLVWNSPWESRASTPGQVYRYRTHFVMRGGELVAQVMRYATSEQGDSVVSVKEGRVVWQDTSGADVAVAVEGEELVGTARSATTSYSVVFKPRP